MNKYYITKEEVEKAINSLLLMTSPKGGLFWNYRPKKRTVPVTAKGFRNSLRMKRIPQK